MFFWFKKNKVTVHALLSKEYSFVERLFPIERASKFIPTWWKQVKRYKNNEWMSTNVSSCMGFINTYQNGYIIPLWSDLLMKYDATHFEYKFADGFSSMEHHPYDQAPGFCDNLLIFKILSPWILTCEKNIKFFYGSTFPVFNNNFDIYGTSGIVELYKSISTHSFIFLKKPNDVTSLKLTNGSPLVHIIPLTDKEVEIKCEVVDDFEYTKHFKLAVCPISFTSRALKIRQIEKKSKVT